VFRLSQCTHGGITPVRNILPKKKYVSFMGASCVSDTLDDALSFIGLDEVRVNHKPRLLSDNGPCYISSELAEYLKENGLPHTRGRPYHPQTQGKIER